MTQPDFVWMDPSLVRIHAYVEAMADVARYKIHVQAREARQFLNRSIGQTVRRMLERIGRAA